MDMNMDYSNEKGLAKQTGGSEKPKFRSGKTMRAFYSVLDRTKRERPTLEIKGLDEDHPLVFNGNIHKNRRWELLEELKQDPSILVLEGDHARDHHQAFRRLPAREDDNDDRPVAELDEEESLLQQYRVSKGGPFRGGVMISKRRKPGKKAVKAPVPVVPPAAVIAVQPDEIVPDSKGRKKRRPGWGFCDCDYCYPPPPARAQRHRNLIDTSSGSFSLGR